LLSGGGSRSRRRELRGREWKTAVWFSTLSCGPTPGGGNVGISLLLRDSQGAVGREGNLFLVFHAFHRPVISTALGRRRQRNRGGTSDSVLQSRSNLAFAVVILRAHSVSLICIACCSKPAKVMFCFKCFAASGMACSFSCGVW
jgi:hypothetical protein